MQNTARKRATKACQMQMTPQQRQLLNEYYDTIAQMRANRSVFENVTDPELISACVYEMNAIQQRYSYLLSRIKEEDIRGLYVLR